MSYSGGQVNTNWMTLAYGGVSNPTITSEQIPVIVDTTTTYSFSVTAAIDNANWASGFTLTLTFYNASGSSVSSVTASSAALLTGIQQTVVTAPTVAPATSVYCAAQLKLNSTPAATNPLDVYYAAVLTGNNTFIPDVVNFNYAFINGIWPWAPSNGAVVNNVGVPLSGKAGNPDSLVLAGIIELMGGNGVPCNIPNLTDPVTGQSAIFRISTPGGSLQTLSAGSTGPYDLGAPQPTQDFVESLLLDGERPFGTRSSNRTMSIPIAIYAPTQQTLNAARDYLLSVIDQQQFELAWTPAATGLTTIYECFRALPSTIMYGFNNLREGASGSPAIGLVTVSLQALPFGKSGVDGTVEIDFATGLVNGAGASTPAVLDNFANGAFTTNTLYGFNNPTSVTTNFTIAHGAVNLAAGDMMLVVVASVTNNVTGVTDAAGNTYTLLSSGSNQAGTMFHFAFASFNSLALTGSITISITGGAANYMSAALTYNGPVSLVSASTVNGATTTATGTIPAGQYGDIAMAIPFSLAGTPATASGWNGHANFGNGYNDNVETLQATSSAAVNFSCGGVGSNWGLTLIRFRSIAIDTNNGWIQNTQFPVIGSGCAFRREPSPAKAPYAPAIFQNSFNPTSIIGLPVLGLWLGQSYDSQFAADPKFVSNVTVTATLYDNQGRTLGCQTTLNKVPWNATSTKPTWSNISLMIPQKNTSFAYGSVVGYKLQVTNWTGGGQSGYVRMNAWLGYLTASPMSVTSSSAPRGILYNMWGLAGSARAAINAQVQLPNTDIITQEFTQSGTFQVPAGVTNLQAECWGAGGAGASIYAGNNVLGAGGGGGEYAAEPSIVVTPGQKIPMTIGAGGIPSLVTPTVQTFNTAGVATSWTCPQYVDRALIECWGGAAAGAPGGGGGGAGGYTQQLVTTTPGSIYSMFVGAGGQPNTGTTSQALASRGGQNTWFGASGTTSIAAAIAGAYGGSSAVAGSSTGGAGGKGFASKYLKAGNPEYVATAATGATTSTTLSWNAGGQTIPAGHSAIVVVATLAQPSMTVSDPANGNWTYLGGAFATNAFQNVFYLSNSKATLGPGSTNQITVTQTISQGMVIGVVHFPWTGVEDVVASRGLANTSTAAGAISATPLSGCNTYVAISVGAASHPTTPTGYTALTQLGAGPFLDVFYNTIPTTAIQNPTWTFSPSQNWTSLMVPMAAGLSYQGGGGGRSPGGAGGGGGASGSLTGAGNTGGSSPKLGASGSGDYLTGGAGGTGPGGNGGAGANVPGAAIAGTIPGGAGGGGYTKTTSSGGHTSAVNYQGAKGAPGQIRISYIPNNNVPVSGGSTVFGSSGTTSAIVTAHGGLSAGGNATFGAVGGSGSTNTSHYFGGRGALSNRSSNGVNNGMMSATTASINNVATGTSTGSNQLTLTSGSTLTSAYMENGVMLVVPVMSNVAPQNPVAVDSAGHTYYLAAQQVLTDSSCLSVFVSALKFPIVTSQTFTLTTSNSINTAGYWGTITGVRDLEDTVIGMNAGNSSTQSVTRTYPDTTCAYFEYQILANNGGASSTGGQGNAPGFNAALGVANGNLVVNAAARMAPGSATALTTSGALGGSMPWATIALPFMCSAQNSQIAPVMPQATGFTGTTGTYTNGTNAAAFNLDASSGYMLVAVHGASSTTSTIGVTDSGSGGSNTYTLLNSVTAGSGAVYLFGAPITRGLSGAWTLTVTSSVSQGYDVNAFFVPGGLSADTAGKGTANATGTAVSLTSTGPAKVSTVQFAMVGYGSATDTLSAPAWTNSILGIQLPTSVDAGRTLATDYFINAGIWVNGYVLTATLSGSVGWGAIAASVVVPAYSAGGGSSAGAGGYGIDGTNGLSGGAPAYNSGGKGANGVTTGNAGLIGSIPGGGGSGSCLTSGSATVLGGPGANGMVRITYQPPLIPFNDWLLHRPGLNAPMDLVPLVPIPPADPPDNREYAIPQTSVGRNARFNGTYTVLLCAATWNTPANSRRVSVTVNQYEYPGGPAVSVQATRTLTPATDIVNGYVSMGELTLPIKQISDSNSDGYYTVSIHDTNQSDSYQDLMFLDTQGATCLVNIAPGTAGDSRYSNYYYDEPGLDTDLGKLLGSSHERDRAISVLDMGMVTGGPLFVTNGNNLLLVYSSKGAPNLRVTYSPRWYSDRII